MNEKGTFLAIYLTDDAFRYIKCKRKEHVKDDVHFSFIYLLFKKFLNFYLIAALEIKLYLFAPCIIVSS